MHCYRVKLRKTEWIFTFEEYMDESNLQAFVLREKWIENIYETPHHQYQNSIIYVFPSIEKKTTQGQWDGSSGVKESPPSLRPT